MRVAPKCLLGGLVTQTDWTDVITVFILVCLKLCGSTKSNNLSFYQNHLIKNPIFFCKYLSPKKLHNNGFIFKIFVWISIFMRKKSSLLIRFLVVKIWNKLGGSFYWCTLYYEVLTSYMKCWVVRVLTLYIIGLVSSTPWFILETLGEDVEDRRMQVRVSRSVFSETREPEIKDLSGYC